MNSGSLVLAVLNLFDVILVFIGDFSVFLHAEFVDCVGRASELLRFSDLKIFNSLNLFQHLLLLFSISLLDYLNQSSSNHFDFRDQITLNIVGSIRSGFIEIHIVFFDFFIGLLMLFLSDLLTANYLRV
jgi:hypothetical protein